MADQVFTLSSATIHICTSTLALLQKHRAYNGSLQSAVERFVLLGAEQDKRSIEYALATRLRKAYESDLKQLYRFKSTMKPEAFTAERDKLDRKYGIGGTPVEVV